jgi:hypothetical protein
MHPFVFVTPPPPANASCDLGFPCDYQLTYILPAFCSSNYVEGGWGSVNFVPEGDEKMEQVAERLTKLLGEEYVIHDTEKVLPLPDYKKLQTRREVNFHQSHLGS